MNKNKNRLLVQCFMKMLQQRLENNKTDFVSPVFASILSKEELQSIVQWAYVDQVPEEYSLETMDKQQLLEAIGSDFYILSYFIDQWKKEIEEKVTHEKVYEVLSQLQLETHYLLSKLLSDWDSYDYANFKALCRKAGTPEPLYAVFESSVLEEDKYISVPLSKYYATEWEAASKKSLLISEEQFEEHQLQILSL